MNPAFAVFSAFGGTDKGCLSEPRERHSLPVKWKVAGFTQQRVGIEQARVFALASLSRSLANMLFLGNRSEGESRLSDTASANTFVLIALCFLVIRWPIHDL